MIGVIVSSAERTVVAEFFELFKTPWEFYRVGQRYDVVLCAESRQVETHAARLVLTYCGRPLPSDGANTCLAARGKQARILRFRHQQLPIYGDCVTFPEHSNKTLVDDESQETAAYRTEPSGLRIGYDLFYEIRLLLTTGQPAAYAGIATLELHIAMLRELILESGLPLVEIPPIPNGYRFIACLTHDVDHPSIRRHKFDLTMLGFLYRALLGSWLDLLRGRASILDLLRNWGAALKLPFVYLGLVDDFWLSFTDYAKIEKGRPSSFFVIPFQGRPGSNTSGRAPRIRAAGYGAADIETQIQKLLAAGCEIGLHGIDAWRDTSIGLKELSEIKRITGTTEVGVRMHWLYYDEHSAAKLEEAGALYDSTVGYNEAVGYRTGTTQAYKPLRVSRLLELPLHVMDTALFYPQRLNLSLPEARKRVDGIINQAYQFGGSLTVNWHDRSIAPERNWRGFYEDLVDKLQGAHAWFSTAAQAVAWFQKRRSAAFESVRWEAATLCIKITVHEDDTLPALQVRIYKPNGGGPAASTSAAGSAADISLSLNRSLDAEIPLENSSDRDYSRSNVGGNFDLPLCMKDWSHFHG
jgi:hypothetical protein